jgi:hypothetical protein
MIARTARTPWNYSSSSGTPTSWGWWRLNAVCTGGSRVMRSCSDRPHPEAERGRLGRTGDRGHTIHPPRERPPNPDARLRARPERRHHRPDEIHRDRTHRRTGRCRRPPCRISSGSSPLARNERHRLGAHGRRRSPSIGRLRSSGQRARQRAHGHRHRPGRRTAGRLRQHDRARWRRHARRDVHRPGRTTARRSSCATPLPDRRGSWHGMRPRDGHRGKWWSVQRNLERHGFTPRFTVQRFTLAPRAPS